MYSFLVHVFCLLKSFKKDLLWYSIYFCEEKIIYIFGTYPKLLFSWRGYFISELIVNKQNIQMYKYISMYLK